MRFHYHPDISEQVKAAEIAVLPRGFDGLVKMNFGQFTQFLVEKQVEHTARRGKGIEIPGVGLIPSFSEVWLPYEQTITQGELRYEPALPHRISFWKGSNREKLVDSTERVDEFVRGLMPTYRVELPEEVVQLPIPEWYEVITDGGGFGIHPWVMFRSHAEKLWKEFVGQKPFDPTVQAAIITSDSVI